MIGVDITTVNELLGHKSLTMTLRYAHLAPSHKVNAVDRLNNALNLKPTAQKLHNFAATAQAHHNVTNCKIMVGDSGFEPPTSAV